MPATSRIAVLGSEEFFCACVRIGKNSGVDIKYVLLAHARFFLLGSVVRILDVLRSCLRFVRRQPIRVDVAHIRMCSLYIMHMHVCVVCILFCTYTP